MKTPYEKKAVLGINNVLFGYPKKKVRMLYLSLLALIFIIGMLI